MIPTNLFRALGLGLLLATAPLAAGCVADDEPAADSQDATARAARFETFTGVDGKKYFQLVAGNGERVLRSQGYSSASAVKTGIASTRTNGKSAAAYELVTAASGETYFNLVATNGKVLATSEPYATKSNAQRAVKSVTAMLTAETTTVASPSGARFATFEGADGKHYFRLHAQNGEVVLQSQGYASKSSATKGIETVKKNAVDAGRFEVLAGEEGQHWFRLLGGSGSVVGRGQVYASKAGAERGAATVQSVVRALVAPGGDVATDAEIKSDIEQAAEGLWYLSESDRPFTHVEAKLAPADAIDEATVRAKLAAYVAADPDRDGPLETLVGMEQSFEDWRARWSDCAGQDDPESCTKTDALNQTLADRLTEVKVFYFGREGEPGNVEGVAVTVFVVGRTPSGNLAGFQTVAVWT